MTAVLERPAGSPAWSSMPGWGIVGDLTPPELINARRLHSLRRIIFAALALLLLLCAAGYGYGMVQHSHATDDLSTATDQGIALNTAAGKYGGITRIETIVSGVRGQIASVMKNDVDLPKLITQIRAALPGSMSLSNLNIALNGNSTSLGDGSASTLDTSGQLHIGTVTMSGVGRSLPDLATYVANLSSLPGVTDVIPTSNELNAKLTQFNLTFTLTDDLYTHHFDVATSTTPSTSTSSTPTTGGN